jgi:UPF0755 protein
VTNEPSWDDIFAKPTGTPPAQPPVSPQQYVVPGAPASMTRREMREAEARGAGGNSGSKSRKPGRSRAGEVMTFGNEPPKRRRRLGWLWALLIILALGASGAAAAWILFEPQVRHLLHWELPIDYTTTGNGVKVDVVIKSGDIGSDIAVTLHDAGVTMTTKAFYQLLLATKPAPPFQPGTFQLQKEMSAKSALAALLDPKNRVVNKVLIKEGATLPQVLAKLADSTGISLEEFQTAAKDYASFGIPSKAPSLEGYLFPATYSFDPDLTAQQILQTMVDRMFTSLDAAGVSEANRHKVVTLAALIQKEGGKVSDFYKVSRVFTNRLDQGMLLQSDATVSYGAGSTGIFTTAAQRADAKNKYNTYVHPGLPIGPICAPGDDAIKAALKPVAGSWLYFVLVNGKTGQTTFSNTIAEHEAAVAVWRQWLKDNPDWKP